MSDRDSAVNTIDDVELARALRVLPDARPQPDLWPNLARALAQLNRDKARRRRFGITATLAAAVALALVIPRTLSHRSEPYRPEPVAASASATANVPAATSAPSVVSAQELPELRRRSQALERWIAGFAHAPQDGRDLMAAVEVEDLIGLVDLQLGATRYDDDALPLWRQRVALLEDLATIRGSAFAIAASDDGSAAGSRNRMN